MSESGPLRLLLVEDDPGVGRLLHRGLIGENYAVEWVRSLAEATAVFDGASFDLVVLDRMLPDGDGAEFCAELRKRKDKTGVLMLTARESLQDKLSGYDAGADDYLTKPFEFDELLVRLAALSRRLASSPDDDAAPLVLDDVMRSLRFGDVAILFTKREWPLFKHLFDHAGEALSRADLIRNVWGDDGAVSENNVDVYVGYLRRKLATGGAPIRIEAVRGVGYVLTR